MLDTIAKVVSIGKREVQRGEIITQYHLMAISQIRIKMQDQTWTPVEYSIQAVAEICPSEVKHRVMTELQQLH